MGKAFSSLSLLWVSMPNQELAKSNTSMKRNTSPAHGGSWQMISSHETNQRLKNLKNRSLRQLSNLSNSVKIPINSCKYPTKNCKLATSKNKRVTNKLNRLTNKFNNQTNLPRVTRLSKYPTRILEIR